MANFAKDSCRTVGFISSNTSNNTAFIAGQYSYLINIRVANVANTTANVSLSWFSSAANTEYSLVSTAIVPVGSYVNFPFEGMALVSNDEIKIEASSANSFHSVLTVVEIPGRSG